MSQPNHHLPNGHSSLSHHATTSNNAASSSLHQNGQSSRHLIARHSSAARDGDSHRPKAPARADIHTIKQELHDELGENGLAYWKALHGYLMGQVGRNEMESLVRTWLKGKGEYGHYSSPKVD
jgi:transcriptional coactivator HFI1/ADA1